MRSFFQIRKSDKSIAKVCNSKNYLPSPLLDELLKLLERGATYDFG